MSKRKATQAATDEVEESTRRFLEAIVAGVEGTGREDLWALLGYQVHDVFSSDEDLDDQRDEVAKLIEDLNEARGLSLPVPRGDEDAERAT